MPRLILDWSFASLAGLHNVDIQATLRRNEPEPRHRPTTFLDLPGEIRNKIYRYLVCPGLNEVSASSTSRFSVAASTEWDIRIMFTCQKIYEEVFYVFYRDHLFLQVKLPMKDFYPELRTFGLEKTLRWLSAPCRGALAAVNLHYDGIAMMPTDFSVLILALHDIQALVDLISYYGLRSVKLRDLRLQLRLTLQTLFKTEATLIDERVLRPLQRFLPTKAILIDGTFLPGLTTTCTTSKPENDNELDSFVSLYSLARRVDYHGDLQEAHALQFYMWRSIEELRYAEISQPKSNELRSITMLQIMIVFYAHSISLAARRHEIDTRHLHSPTTLLRRCFHMLIAIDSSERLRRFGRAFENYIKFAYHEHKDRCSPRFHNTHNIYEALIAFIDEDPADELGLGVRMLSGYRRRLDKEQDACGVRNDRLSELVLKHFLVHEELDGLLSRLWRVTGLDEVPNGQSLS